MDLSAAEQPGVHRIDVRELNHSLQSLARCRSSRRSAISARRKRRRRRSALTVKRFADAGVLAAAADRAVATTLITSEGRALTEVTLQLRNRSQPFLKVKLPPGATIVSVDLAGQSASPRAALMARAFRLMRAGLRPTRPVHGVVRLRARRHAVPQEGRHRHGVAEDGHSDRRRRMGGLRARAVHARARSTAT